jgi:hypothetical protein
MMLPMAKSQGSDLVISTKEPKENLELIKAKVREWMMLEKIVEAAARLRKQKVAFEIFKTGSNSYSVSIADPDVAIAIYEAIGVSGTALSDDRYRPFIRPVGSGLLLGPFKAKPKPARKQPKTMLRKGKEKRLEERPVRKGLAPSDPPIPPNETLAKRARRLKQERREVVVQMRANEEKSEKKKPVYTVGNRPIFRLLPGSFEGGKKR